MKQWLFVSLSVVLGACGGTPTETAPLTNDDFAEFLNVDLNAMTRTVSGLYWQDLTVGGGDEAVLGASVEVEYSGWLIDGTLFDSSRDRTDPFIFTIGQGQVIRGWDEGIRGMRVGGERKLVIPPNLGYGPQGRPGSIPPNATLVFDVELIAVNP